MIATRTPWQSTRVLALATVLLAGCAAPGPVSATPDPAGSAALAVPGVAPCSELPHKAEPGGAASDRLPSLTLPCLRGDQRVDLTTLGGPMLINLWASWCGPCRAEMPALQAAYEGYDGRVAFLGVDTKDGTESAVAFLDAVGVAYPQVVDTDGDLLTSLGPPGLPVTVVIGADGRVAGMHVGQVDGQALYDLLAKVAP